MHLDYRFYVKFRSKTLWEKWMQSISIEATDGKEYSLLDISLVFSSPEGMMNMMEPVGMIFDTVTVDEEEAFCFIHDNRKPFAYFMRLSEYLFDEAIQIAEDDAVIIADLTDYDTDLMGDYIGYYLGGGKANIRQCVVAYTEEPEHHEVEISDFKTMLKYEILSLAQKEKLKDLTKGMFPINLMDSLRMTDLLF